MTHSGNRFLVIPTIGLWKSLATDSSFIFLMTNVTRLVEKGNYAFVVLPKDIDLAPIEKWKREGIMFLTCDIPARALDTQMAVIDQAFISETFGFQYGKYVVDAGIVLHGSQVIPLKQAVHPRGPIDCFPVFCLEQGVSWTETEPGYQEGRFDESLNVLGASYSHLACMSAKDRRIYLTKARHFDLSAYRYAELERNSWAGAAPVDIKALQLIAASAVKNKVPTLLYAARTNKTKHPENIVEIFDELYKQNENVQVTYITQTSELKASIMSKRRHLFDERQYIKPRTDVGREDFYAEASKSHVFVCWSDSESYNQSAVEASMVGCVFCCHDTAPHRELYDGNLGGDQFWLRDRNDAVEKLRWICQNYDVAYKMQQGLRDRFIKQQEVGNVSEWVHNRAINFHQANVADTFGKLYYYKLADNSELAVMIKQIIDSWPNETISLADVLVGLEAHGDAFSTDNMYRAISRVMPVNWNIHQMLKLHFNLVDTCNSRFPSYRINK